MLLHRVRHLRIIDDAMRMVLSVSIMKQCTMSPKRGSNRESIWLHILLGQTSITLVNQNFFNHKRMLSLARKGKKAFLRNAPFCPLTPHHNPNASLKEWVSLFIKTLSPGNYRLGMPCAPSTICKKENITTHCAISNTP